MRVQIPYTPRAWQTDCFDALTRFAVWVIHRRAGKTVLAINTLIRRIIETNLPDARGGYVAPYYSQAKRIVWNYLRLYTSTIPGMRYKESELIAIFPNGDQIALYGADRGGHAMRGEYFDSLVLDEVAQQAPTVWTEVLRPALADRQGSALFIGTPHGRMNLFHDLFIYATQGRDGQRDPAWSAQLLTVDDTNAIDDDELRQARMQMSSAAFRQEFYCDWSAQVQGSFYSELLDNARREDRISDQVIYDPSLPVIASWDLGLRDATVITYWQVTQSYTNCIACDAFTNSSLADIARHQQANRPWSIPYQIFPHDAAVREQQADGDLITRQRIAEQHGITVRPATRLSREEGIEAVRMMLPRARFNATACQVLLEALAMYRAEYNDSRRTFALTPVHDWSSDYADSVRYFAATVASRQATAPGYDFNTGQLDMVDALFNRRVA